MTNSTFKKTIAATLTVATLATAAFATSTTAQAGSKDFWRGAAVGAVTGVVAGSIIRHNNRQNEVVYVERQRPRTVVVQRQPAYTPAADGHAWSDDQHERWCLRKYRSYDVRSDTYQPFNGGRRYCNSPYN